MTVTHTPESASPIAPRGTTTTHPIPARRVSFAPSIAEVPRYFCQDGDLVMSHTMAALSSVFPDGEDFFVRSVRHFRDRVTDPDLKRHMTGFIGQEAIHGREHRELNDRLDELGYSSKRMEEFTRRGLAFRERVMSPESNLATTAALEHFTATLAEIILSDQSARDQLGESALTDVLVWHALEECEHKAVAFDVFKAVGGTEKTRRRMMNLTCFSFLGGMSVQIVISLLGDRNTYRRGQLLPSLRRAKRSPFLQKSVWRKIRDYNRPDFHPNDHDTEALLAEWTGRLFGEDGQMNHRLAAHA